MYNKFPISLPCLLNNFSKLYLSLGTFHLQPFYIGYFLQHKKVHNLSVILKIKANKTKIIINDILSNKSSFIFSSPFSIIISSITFI